MSNPAIPVVPRYRNDDLTPDQAYEITKKEPGWIHFVEANHVGQVYHNRLTGEIIWIAERRPEHTFISRLIAKHPTP